MIRGAGLGLALGFACLAPAPALSGGVSGGEAVALIRAAMQQHGLPAPDMAAPLRPLPACDHPPLVLPQAGGWATVALRCTAPLAWTRVLRTGSRAMMLQDDAPAAGAGEAAPLTLTLRQPLPRGARITAADLVLHPVAGIDPAQRLRDPAQAVGRVLRRALGEGQPLLERHLDPALDVEPGQQVTIHLQQDAIQVAATGTALAGGRIGARIPVRPVSGGDPVEALIIAPGLVQPRPNMPPPDAVQDIKRRLSWSQ
jgi:flagellar basal body P-ring formation protein FlgA